MLRIEDIDTARCRPAFETAFLDDLAWLGLSWETPRRRQSEHLADYRAALARLNGRGVLYRCFRTRKHSLDDIARAPHGAVAPSANGPMPPEEERALTAAGRPFAWRLSIAAARDALGGLGDLAFLEEGAGPAGERGLIAAGPGIDDDVILARKDLGVSYHLAVVVDDAAQGVTHVIRGADLFAVTPVQRLLQALLDLPAPVYRHHPLLLRPDGKRFAKRDTAETLRSLREGGMSAAALRADLGF